MELNSLIFKEYPFEQVEYPQAIFEIRVSEAEVDRRLSEVGERFLSIENVSDAIQMKDIVTFSTDREGYETIQLVVGKGFYGDEFEISLIGKQIGMKVDVPLWGGNTPGTIEQIHRRNIPEVTDELIQKLELNGVETIETYREQLRAQIAESEKWRKADGIIGFTEKEVIRNTEFGELSHETSNLLGEVIDQSQKIAELEGLSYLECLPWQLPEKYLSAEDEVIKDYNLLQCEDMLKRRLIAKAWANRIGLVLTDSDYEEACIKLTDEGMPEEMFEINMRKEDFFEQGYVNRYQDAVLDACEDKYNTVLVP